MNHAKSKNHINIEPQGAQADSQSTRSLLFCSAGWVHRIIYAPSAISQGAFLFLIGSSFVPVWLLGLIIVYCLNTVLWYMHVCMYVCSLAVVSSPFLSPSISSVIVYKLAQSDYTYFRGRLIEGLTVPLHSSSLMCTYLHMTVMGLFPVLIWFLVIMSSISMRVPVLGTW